MTARNTANARRSAADTLIALVPRLSSVLAPQQLPIGNDIWRDTALVLPAAISPGELCDLFTGHRFVPDVDPEGRSSLGVGRVLSRLPVALLRTTSPPG